MPTKKLKDIWANRVQLQVGHCIPRVGTLQSRPRLQTAIVRFGEAALGGRLSRRYRRVVHENHSAEDQKTQRPVQSEIIEQTRVSLAAGHSDSPWRVFPPARRRSWNERMRALRSSSSAPPAPTATCRNGHQRRRRHALRCHTSNPRWSNQAPAIPSPSRRADSHRTLRGQRSGIRGLQRQVLDFKAKPRVPDGDETRPRERLPRSRSRARQRRRTEQYPRRSV